MNTLGRLALVLVMLAAWTMPILWVLQRLYGVAR